MVRRGAHVDVIAQREFRLVAVDVEHREHARDDAVVRRVLAEAIDGVLPGAEAPVVDDLVDAIGVPAVRLRTDLRMQDKVMSCNCMSFVSLVSAP